MARGCWLLFIWPMLMVICGSSAASKRMFLAAMFDIPYDHSLKDDAAFYKVPQSLTDNKLMRNYMKKLPDYHHIVPLLFTKRRQNIYSNVEVGPGAIKSEMIEYPSDTLRKQLSNLLRLKKKLEQRRVP